MAARSRVRCEEATSTALTPCTLQVHGVEQGYEEDALLRAVVRPLDVLREDVLRRDEVLRDAVLRALVLRALVLRALVLRRRVVERAPAGLRSRAGTSSRITAPASVVSWRPRNACMRSSSRRICLASLTVSLSPSLSATASMIV